jgi:hypothetical protein
MWVECEIAKRKPATIRTQRLRGHPVRPPAADRPAELPPLDPRDRQRLLRAVDNLVVRVDAMVGIAEVGAI